MQAVLHATPAPARQARTAFRQHQPATGTADPTAVADPTAAAHHCPGGVDCSPPAGSGSRWAAPRRASRSIDLHARQDGGTAHSHAAQACRNRHAAAEVRPFQLADTSVLPSRCGAVHTAALKASAAGRHCAHCFFNRCIRTGNNSKAAHSRSRSRCTGGWRAPSAPPSACGQSGRGPASWAASANGQI